MCHTPQNFKARQACASSEHYIKKKTKQKNKYQKTKQFSHINGLQDTINTPFFVVEKNVWNTEKQFKSQNAPYAQIHFDGNSLWTMGFATDANSVYYMYIESFSDNLKELKSNIKIQLSQIYRSKSKTLHVKIPRVYRQPRLRAFCNGKCRWVLSLTQFL